MTDISSIITLLSFISSLGIISYFLKIRDTIKKVSENEVNIIKNNKFFINELDKFKVEIRQKIEKNENMINSFQQSTRIEIKRLNELCAKLDNTITKLDITVSNLNSNIEKSDEIFERMIDRVYKDFDDFRTEIRNRLQRKES